MRFRVAALAALLAAAPALADPPRPAVVVRAQPASRLLAEYKEMVRQVGGPLLGEGLARQFEEDLKDAVGEQGFEGLDLNRPLAAYAVAREKAEDCTLVLVLPAAGEKEFLALLGRAKVKAEPVKDKKGLYALTLPEEVFPKASHLRFADGGWAYLTLNDGDPTDAKDLVPVGELLDAGGPALVSVKVYPGRVPEKLVGGWLEEVENTANMLKGFLGGAPGAEMKLMAAILEHGPKLLRRYAETGLKEAAEVGIRFSWDQQAGDTVTDITLVPKPNTPLAKDIAAKPPTTHRFAGMIPKDAAAGALVKVPVFAKEVQEIGAAIAEAAAEQLKGGDLPESFKPVVDELTKGFARTLKKGEGDAAVALLGPDRGDKFTLVGAASFDDPAALEKALRTAARPADLAKHFEFDVAKVGGVGVHKIPLTRALPEDAAEELKKVFGDTPPAYVAFARDAAFLAVGPDALAAIKAAVEAKPGPAPAVDLTINPKRFAKLVTAVDEKIGGEFAKHFGADDKPATALRVTVEGGKELRVKATFNVRYIPKLFVVADAVAPPPPGR